MQTAIPLNEARRHLGELINEAFYQGKPFVLTRGNKPMATLIGANEWKEVIKTLEKYNPGLADTLAIMANKEVQAILRESEENIRKGEVIKEEEWLNE